jgi:SRSO17 transposase
MSASTASWQEALDHWLEPFLARLNRSAQKRWMATYLKGLMLPGERKSIEPMAARVAPGAVQQLHHFVSTSPWLTGPLEDELIRQADRLLGGPDAVLVIDDTALPKQGVHSVGVARQYCGCLGKRANGQVLVSLTLARDEVPIPIVLRLFLPEKWVDDPARCDAAGVPEDRRRRLAKPDLALEELDRVRALGVRFSAVLTDAGYGISAAFRQALSARELVWAAGIPRIQKVFPSEVVMVRPVPKRGRSRQTAIPATEAITAETMLKSRPWRTITWREGTKGPLTAAFARRRVRVADGPTARLHGHNNQHLPGEEVWLVGERRTSGERKYYLSNLPARATLKQLAATIKAALGRLLPAAPGETDRWLCHRWVCEQAHQQLKEELGLDHLECRSWRALHHHALLAMLAFTFLQQRRLGEKTCRRLDRSRTATATHAARGASADHRGPDRDRDPLPRLPPLLHPSAPAMNMAE